MSPRSQPFRRCASGLELQIAFGVLALGFVFGWAVSQSAAPAPTSETKPTKAEPAAKKTSQPTRPAPPRKTTEPVEKSPAPRATKTSGPAPIKVVKIGGLGPDRVLETSRALFQNVPQGLELLEALQRDPRWKKLAQGRRFNAVMDPVVAALAATTWEARAKALETLDEAVEEHGSGPTLKGSLGGAVTQEIARWARLAEGARALRRSIRDPRGRAGALTILKKMPPTISVRRDALLLVRLVDWIDHHQRWVRVRERRAELTTRRKQLVKQLRDSALGRLLLEEVLAVSGILEQLLRDPEGMLIAALASPATAALPRSEFLGIRLLEVPRKGTTTNMPGWGVLVELEKPLRSGEVIVQIEGRTTIKLSSGVALVGTRRFQIAWGSATRIYVEARPQGVLVRMPGARPEDLVLTESEVKEQASRFTVRLVGGAVRQRVALAQIPHRSKALFRER